VSNGTQSTLPTARQPYVSRTGRTAGMQNAAVVPDQEVSACPAMFVNELRLLLTIEQGFKQRVAFLRRYADDTFRHQAIDIECFAVRDGVLRVPSRRSGALTLLGGLTPRRKICPKVDTMPRKSAPAHGNIDPRAR
jgi:hypothetical protein